MHNTGQGSIEYLLIVGGAIIVAAVIIVFLSSSADTTTSGAEMAAANAQCAQYGESACPTQIITLQKGTFICQFDYATNKCNAKKVDAVISTNDCTNPTWEDNKTYLLGADNFASTSACFSISGKTNVTLSCGGKKIIQTGAQYAINFEGTNSSIIQNCAIESLRYGIKISNGSNNQIIHNSLTLTTPPTRIGIYAASNNLRIQENTVSIVNPALLDLGVNLVSGTNTLLKNNTACNGGTGYYSLYLGTSPSNESADNRCTQGTCYESATTVICDASGTPANCAEWC